MSTFMKSLVNRLSFAEKKQEPVEITEASIKLWLVQRMAKQLKIDPADVETDRSFDSYGLDSIVAVQVAGDLEKFLEQRLSPALLFEHRSIDELTRYLASELVTSEA
ncbi:acyl carrier protein [Billgrantia kenyensis]|uniref:Acyl carrier protein n=1 Tax=Billgrantia kenyensis TaxID=321266 RepID=A0A7W0AEA2_9GAMM|nr:acyl carrier protein [Halomonas kenyensis]MBA2779439.1 acyl carrier protein [Halomonas kenyensis]MCG6662672.1 acyl carrier protein [Halomonas kenyensis]